MSTRKYAWLTLVSAGALVWAAAAAAETGNGRLGTFEQNGQQYFALSLMPQAAADPGQKCEVVILVDTSASQSGRYRTEELAAVQSLLATLRPEDRVQLMAVDMKATPLNAGFVTPQSAEMRAAVNKLNSRTPLGATDLEAGLRAAADSFAVSGPARTVIYIGDAMSKSNVFTDASLRKLVSDLRGAKVSVSSFVVGQEQNTQLMAALANHTGGLVQVDRPEGGSAATTGQLLAASVHAGVVWPSEVSLSGNVSAMYPTEMPPLRSDRDSILIGTLSNVSPVNVGITGTLNGKPVKWSWNVNAEKPSEDFGFLPKLVDLAASDKGLSLPTAGSGGLREAAYVTLNSAQQLAKLGGEALASGNYASAARVADAALARDPGNPEAQAIKAAATKGISAGKAQPTNESDLKLNGTNVPTSAGGLLAEVLAEPPGFLGRVNEERRVLAGKIRAEVENSLSTARKNMGQNPDQAEQDLKLTLEEIERTPDLEPEVRARLRQQVENAVRLARQRKVEVDLAVANAEEQKASAREQERLNDSLAIQTQRLKQLVDRFGSLMAEQRYSVADEEIVPEVQQLAPGSTIDSSLFLAGRFQRAVHDNEAIWRVRENNFFRTLYAVETSLVPFPADPPIVYLPPTQWEDLTRRRQKYKAVDLGKQGGAEQRIYTELNKNTDIDAVEMALKDVVQYFADKHNIPIVLSTKKLEEIPVSVDTPVTKQLRGVTLRSALRLVLKDLELTYVVRDEVLQITTPEDAESSLITKVYPVGDLVVPVANFGGGGMMGGGMMGGGMMGGMGGGMGGMGGGMGMGGMGGGMGGMGMGGMGGGMFAVEDELSLGTKKTAPGNTAAPAKPEAPRARSKSAKVAARITVQPAASETTAEAWDRYFAGQEERLSSLEKAAPALTELLASVRETVRQLMVEKQYAEVATLIQAALRHGQVESWMYEALALAIRADSLDKINQGITIDAAQTEALERALLSAVDFAQDEDQLVLVAAYMAQAGLERRALSVYQQISKANPSRPEPLLQGLALAQRLNDVQAIQWACVGILSQAWSGEHRELAERAYRIGKATFGQLLEEGRKDEAEAFDAAVRKAQERDCVVVVKWTGDADIDVTVEEPAGTIVSQRQPRSTSGGVHLGDVSSADGKSTTKGFSEAYVCPEGFAGKYRVLIKNIWGRPTSGKVTVDVYTHFSSDKQTFEHGQIPVDEKNAVVEFDLNVGRRKESLPEAQVAVAKIQNAANRALLAQQIASAGSSSASQSFAGNLATGVGLGFVPGFFLRGAVGYRPVISTLPTGATMQVQSAVISADRRYVRVSPSPFFSQVTEVNTFNFVSGQGGTQGAGQGGVGAGSAGGFGGGGIGGGGIL